MVVDDSNELTAEGVWQIRQIAPDHAYRSIGAEKEGWLMRMSRRGLDGSFGHQRFPAVQLSTSPSAVRRLRSFS